MSHNLSTICSKYTTCVVAGKDVVPRLSMVSLTRLLKELNESSPLRRGIRYLETSIGQMKTKIEQSMKSIQLPLQSYPSTQIERERSAYETHTSAVKHSPEAQNPLKSWFEQALPFLKPQGDTSNPATHSSKDHPLEIEQDHMQAGNESKQMMDSGEGLDDPEALENNTIIPELYPPGEILQVYRPNSSQLIIVTSKPEAYQEIQLSSTMLSDHMPSIYSHLCSALLERSLEHPFVTKRKS